MGTINTNTIIFFIIIIVVFYLIHLFFLKKEVGPAEFQWRVYVKPKFKEIDEIYDTYVSKGKKPSIFKKKDVKNVFAECKNLYKEYISICKDCSVKPNMSKGEFENYIDNVENPLLSENELLDKELDRTREYYDEEYNIFCISIEELYNTKKDNEHTIDEIENFINTISSQPKSFEIDINEINVQKMQFKSACEYGKERQKDVEKALKGTTTSLAMGGAFAAASPNIALWAATTFGTSSTGVAISALSGAVQYNAAVAWLGGGAIAAGGGGMAAGQALLALAGPIGWGLAGTSILLTVISMWKKFIKQLETKKNSILEMKRWTNSLKNLKLKIDFQIKQIIDFSNKLNKMLLECSKLKGCDYTSLSDSDKYLLGTLVNNTKSLSLLLNKNPEEIEE